MKIGMGRMLKRLRGMLGRGFSGLCHGEGGWLARQLWSLWAMVAGRFNEHMNESVSLTISDGWMGWLDGWLAASFHTCCYAYLPRPPPPAVGNRARSAL
jgi:hypothetical protein